MPQQNLASTLFTLTQSYRLIVRDAINATELGLNALHVKCLHIIADTPHCTANDIVNKTQRDKAQIARLIKELLSLALIAKCADENDKRCFILSLTNSGKTLYKTLKQAESTVDTLLCKGLDQAQIDNFLMVANTMINNVNNQK
ncbi:MarR family transcriptional regulator [Pseudoalteromonas sp. S1727]|uniref:MarR family winged helix-turn-helix transcriptional regulator n=1 Tax=Pseudoalteromonas sp. S1727 TaxID=2066514 RepID=UPI001108B1A0|nr:MarR family transcriptional regulator [Pseudoalteromonas sp. S1727]TMN72764.1 MarR family transcriptional regulator [Pseudoalteromonas sp. S1727]